MPAGVVWFKRDLRLDDHRPLKEAVAGAARRGQPVVCVYAVEPESLVSPEWDPRHSGFVEECLAELDIALRARGTALTRLHGNLPDAFLALHERLAPVGGVGSLWSHEETGGRISYDRDRSVKAWCERNGVGWTEFPQHGVFRGLPSRDGWAGRWSARMREPPTAPPASIPCVTAVMPNWDFGTTTAHAKTIPTDASGGRPVRSEPSTAERQRGGASMARDVLDSFLRQRGVNYRADMASPVTGFDGCSRLSAHLAWGSISIRTVHHALRQRQQELKAMAPEDRDPRWLKSLSSFQGRLRWHCHFIQKLESEPDIEHRNMHHGYDGLRTESKGAWSEQERLRFEAWAEGRTGYPFVDACMRCLRETGWMNFRMRSMLVSFASYHLWLHWRFTGEHLARLFLDFEPGIHWSQMQMQSGTTGINTVRIYNPVKQGLDQDPSGAFIRRWVPELASVPDEHIHEPWKHTGANAGLLFQAADPGTGYPGPIVDHKAAYRHAQQRIFEVRKRAESRAEAKRVYLKHGSRKRSTDRPYRGGPEDRATA